MMRASIASPHRASITRGSPPSSVSLPLPIVGCRAVARQSSLCCPWSPPLPARRRGDRWCVAQSAMSENLRTVWALDFDGMLCDSVGESALTAWKAASKIWPEIFETSEAEAKKEDVIEGMRVARPVIETGYENIPMVRALLEGVTPESMLGSWETMLPSLMQKYGLERSSMVEAFGTMRDEWIKEDLQGWLAPNRFYPGIAEATKVAFGDRNCEMYIVTTKQARFTEALMRDMAGIPFPLDRIYSQTVSGQPKSEVLQMLQERHPNAQNYLFFEDKMGTLEMIAPMDNLKSWKLYLVDWGYNTAEERARAEGNDRIHVIGPEEYTSLMKI